MSATEPGWQPDPVGEASWRWWGGRDWTGDVAPARQAPELAPLGELIARQSLKLEQQGVGGADTLVAAGRPAGYLYKTWTGEATGETSAGSWRFDRQGLLSGIWRVLVQPADQEIGRFALDSLTAGAVGTLQFVDGRWFRLTTAQQLAAEGVASPAPYDPSHAVWVWYGPDRVPFATVRLAAPPQKTKTIFGMEVKYTTYGTGQTSQDVWVDLHPAAASVRELPLVTLAGTYVVWAVISARDAARSRRRSRF